MARTYTQDEVREIIRRAAESTAEKERQASEDTGLTVNDLRDLAVGAGIDPEVMLEAAQSLDRDVHEPFEKRVLGMKISAARAIRVEGPFTEEDWLALVSDCRTTFEAKGKVQDVSGLREWSNGNLHVLVEPVGEDVIIRMRTHHGATQQMAAGSVAMAIAMFVMVITAMAEGASGPETFGMVSLLAAVFFGAGGLLFTQIRRWSRTREQQMEAIGRRIQQRRERSRTQDADTKTAKLEASVSPTIEIPEEPEQIQVEGNRNPIRERRFS